MPIIQDGNPNPDRIRVNNEELYRVYRGGHLVWQKPSYVPPVDDCEYDCESFLARPLLHHYPFDGHLDCLIQGTSASIINVQYGDGLFFPNILDFDNTLDADMMHGTLPVLLAPYMGLDVDADHSYATEDDELADNPVGFTWTAWFRMDAPIKRTHRIFDGKDGLAATIIASPTYNQFGPGFSYNGQTQFLSIAGFLDNEWYFGGGTMYYSLRDGHWKSRMYGRGPGYHEERNFLQSIASERPLADTWVVGRSNAYYPRQSQAENMQVKDLRIWGFPFTEKDTCGKWAQFDCLYDYLTGAIDFDADI